MFFLLCWMYLWRKYRRVSNCGHLNMTIMQPCSFFSVTTPKNNLNGRFYYHQWSFFMKYIQFDNCLQAEKIEFKVCKQTYLGCPNGGQIIQKTKKKGSKDDYYKFFGALSKRRKSFRFFRVIKERNSRFLWL